MDTERASVLPVGVLMRPEFVSVDPSDTLGEAAEKMSELDVGSALVIDSGHLVGILTSRDLMRALAGRTHSSEARVREWMTPDPRVARLDTPAAEDFPRDARACTRRTAELRLERAGRPRECELRAPRPEPHSCSVGLVRDVIVSGDVGRRAAEDALDERPEEA